MSSGVAIEGAGTDADRTRVATAIVIKISATSMIGIGGHLVKRDGAVGGSIQTISSGVAIEGAGTDADRTGATTAVVSKIQRHGDWNWPSPC